jgi:hypothetical protein
LLLLHFPGKGGMLQDIQLRHVGGEGSGSSRRRAEEAAPIQGMCRRTAKTRTSQKGHGISSLSGIFYQPAAPAKGFQKTLR